MIWTCVTLSFGRCDKNRSIEGRISTGTGTMLLPQVYNKRVQPRKGGALNRTHSYTTEG